MKVSRCNSVDYWLLDTQMQPLNLDLTHRVSFGTSFYSPARGHLIFLRLRASVFFSFFFLFIFLFSRRLESFNNW